MRPRAAGNAVAVLVACAVLYGCAQPAPPPEPDPGPEQDVMTMSGVDLYLHGGGPTQGRMENPTLWVHANEYELTGEEDHVHAFRDARAVVYGKKREEKAIVFTAQRGRMVEGKSAYLSGNVEAQLGDMTMHLADVHWENPGEEETGGVAHTDEPVQVKSPSVDLAASSLRIFPENHEFELTDVSGIIYFGRNTS